MEMERSNPWKFDFGRGYKPLINRAIRMLFFCAACVCVTLPCRAQEPAPPAQPAAPPAQAPATPAPQTGTAQSSTPTGDKTESDKKDDKAESDKKDQKKKKPSRGAFVVAPLPISSPAIGTGLVPVVGYIFPFSTKDKVSPPSTIGAAGLITNNGSRGFAVGGQLFFDEDRYEITSGFVHGNVNYNIYGTGDATGLQLPLAQTGYAFFAEGLRRVGWKFFVGPRFINGHSIVTVRPNTDSDFPIPPEVGLHTNLTSLGAHVLRDTRPNHFYPLGGTYFSFTSDFFAQALGSKYSFQSYRSEFDKYWSLSDKQVLAYDAYFCGTGGSPPFYGNCIYGTSNELRGYIAGQYFTRYSLATQLEYRLVLPKRFGLVVFGGLGGVIPGGAQVAQMIQTSHFLPAGGGGLRFELSKKYHVNLRADIAQGVNGHTFGMGVGEAF